MHKRVRDERDAFKRNVDMSTVQDRETIGLPRWEGTARDIDILVIRERRTWSVGDIRKDDTSARPPPGHLRADRASARI